MTNRGRVFVVFYPTRAVAASSTKSSVDMMRTLIKILESVAAIAVQTNVRDSTSGEKYNKRDIVSAFLSEPNAARDSPLHAACGWGKQDIALMLYDHGGTMCRTNGEGMDWLMMLICYRHGQFRPPGAKNTDMFKVRPVPGESAYGTAGTPESAPASVGWKINLSGKKCTVVRVREYYGCVPSPERETYKSYMSTILHEEEDDEERFLEEELDLEFAHEIPELEFAWYNSWGARAETKLMEQLLSRGVSTTHECLSGMTSLHYACRFGDFEFARLLLKAGADPLKVGGSCVPTAASIGSASSSGRRQSQTPLQVAKALGHKDIEDMLNEDIERRRIESEHAAEQLMLELLEDEEKTASKASKKKKKKKNKTQEPGIEEPVVATTVEEPIPIPKEIEGEGEARAKVDVKPEVLKLETQTPQVDGTDDFEIEAEIEVVTKATAMSTIAEDLEDSDVVKREQRRVEENTNMPWRSMSSWATITRSSVINSSAHQNDDDDGDDELKPPSVMDFSSEWHGNGNLHVHRNIGRYADDHSPAWLAVCADRMERVHPKARAVGLGCEHILGYGTDALSAAQLEAAEEVHRELLARLSDARVRLAVEQERQKLYEAKELEGVYEGFRKVHQYESMFSR